MKETNWYNGIDIDVEFGLREALIARRLFSDANDGYGGDD